MKSHLDLTRLTELDRRFNDFAHLKHQAAPRCGWAKTIRLALGMSSPYLAKRLGISGQGVRKLEQAEADGTISIKTLSRLADGLDCEVHYVLVPRTSLLNQVLARLQERAGKDQGASTKTWVLPCETEVMETLSALRGQLNRRGLW